ncbi:hypothetical protein SPI_02793 [Niveomyces insectorum RCEF 264]|uniref:Uncharacterized protein n=1 Tax=Niveomyces insectorum RCEF 264 TaxID=1081102 RepID=A0A167Y989_9HYPO|nr:hypothetical protein SPI_02793 [Niveomyces insectorum RCEF 264]
MLPLTNVLARGHLIARSLVNTSNDDDDDNTNAHAVTVMIALLAIVFFGLLLALSLLMLRRAKRQQQLQRMATLPQYAAAAASGNTAGASGGKGHGLTIQTTHHGHGRQSVLLFSRDGQPMLANPQSPPYSPDNVPEIRITFPDEHDETGRRKSGRVVVVRVGETAIGMEPLSDEEEQLPAYEKESKSQFYSIDIDKIGGLKEKDYRNYQ